MSDASGPAVGPDALRELAHRLRSPLGVIQGYASLLEDHLSAEGGDSSAAQWARLVCDEVGVLSALLGDLSRWTTLETTPPVCASFAVRPLLAEVGEEAHRANAANLAVEGDDLQLSGDRALIRRALLHLVRPFGSKPMVRLSIIDGWGSLRLESAVIQAPEIKAQDPWLTYARAVVEAHGGEVAWDVRGVTVNLPLALPE